MECDFLLVERMELHTKYLLLYKGFCSLHRMNKDHLVKKVAFFVTSEFFNLKDKKPQDNKNLKLLLDI